VIGNLYLKNRLWILFVLFTTSNGLIAYSELPFWTKVLVGLIGIFFPFLLILLNSQYFINSQRQEMTEKSLPGFQLWIMVLLAALAFFLRFYQLSGFSTWPSTDDAWFGTYALDLYEKWNWNLLFGYIKFPALNFWPLTLLFKFFGPSFFSFFYFDYFFFICSGKRILLETVCIFMRIDRGF